MHLPPFEVLVTVRGDLTEKEYSRISAALGSALMAASVRLEDDKIAPSSMKSYLVSREVSA